MQLTNFLTVNGMLFMMGSWVFLISFISGRKHLLGTLLSLEGVMLMLFGLLSYLSGVWTFSFGYSLVFLTLVACEGALALSLLVVAVRWWGEDRVLSLNTLMS